MLCGDNDACFLQPVNLLLHLLVNGIRYRSWLVEVWSGRSVDMELCLNSLDSAQLRLKHHIVSLQDILQALLGLDIEEVLPLWLQLSQPVLSQRAGSISGNNERKFLLLALVLYLNHKLPDHWDCLTGVCT